MAPVDFMMLATGAKSFRGNQFIGSPALNRRGLHVHRLKIAKRMADLRRRRLRHLVSDEDAETFARDGLVIRRNVLPDNEFETLRDSIAETEFLAREMRQGGTVTRFIDLPPSVLEAQTLLARFVRGGLFQGLLRYVASTNADPLVYLHIVFATPETGRRDPQTTHHSDTFHATAKGWFFLHDVEIEDGPFTYVPGSHRLTPGRIDWEFEQSLKASTHPNGHHALGSFRATRAEIEAMGNGPTIALTVPANTLVVADMHGFHARGIPTRPSVRPAIYGSLRRNPFLPWTGLDLGSLPGLKGRKSLLFGAYLDLCERNLGQANGQPLIGRVRPFEPSAHMLE